ncbi:MAG: hypothetical protein OXI16_04160 [Chloroflexota bacterium]|nr:hypothetical protein [Chloroflexota bacterium]
MRYRKAIRGIGAVFALVAVAAILAPLAGPAFDHHFAERQPGHLHFGAVGEHIHAFESAFHYHPRPRKAPSGDTPIALYKSEAGIAATIVASHMDVDAAALRQYQPTSVFILPPAQNAAARQYIPHIPHRPPALV